LVRVHIPSALAAIGDTPAVLISGPRQAGKSTLVKYIAGKEYPASYISLDDVLVLSSAVSDPAGFISRYKLPIVIDEVQKAPALLSAVKTVIDRNRKPGMFILTGSANVLSLPKISESLAGRMEVLTLYPFSQGEIIGLKESFADYIFSSQPLIPYKSSFTKQDYFKASLLGGFPEILQRKTQDRRNAWFGSYLNTIVQRDIREISDITKLTEIPRLLSILASRSCSLLNISELSRAASIPQTTLKRYLSLLMSLYFINLIVPYSPNIGKPFVKSPRVIFSDTGILSYLLGKSPETHDWMQDSTAGQLLENFAVVELVKQNSWSKTQPRILYFREPKGKEVDIVLEARDGRIVGLEVKATSNVSSYDISGLKKLAEITSRKFVKGIVLYTGTESVPLTNNITAIPMDSLWRMVSR
jgi:predicted AAA+ superfamily ATPase